MATLTRKILFLIVFLASVSFSLSCSEARLDPVGLLSDAIDTNDTDSLPDTQEATDGDDQTTGPAAELYIDGDVHTGTNGDGSPYEGVWGEPFSFKMADYPLTWAIATVHASMLLKSRQIPHSPNALLGIAIKESRLQCTLESFPNQDGCFQMENTTAYEELKKLFAERFTATHANIVGLDHFESAALASVYYTIFSMAMFYKHSDDPAQFFLAHPDEHAQQKIMSAAYNKGLWWTGLENAFSSCAAKDVAECFEKDLALIDHVNAVTNYTIGLDGKEPFDTPVSLADLKDYWSKIKLLYPDANSDTINAVLETVYNEAKNSSQAISFHKDIKKVLRALIQALPKVATVEDARNAVCVQGYLSGDQCASS